jgi:integrase
VRSGEGTLAYWKGRLFRNTYNDRDGQTVEIPEYYVRMRHNGVSRRVRLHNSDKDRAAEEALGLASRLQTEGWSAITSRQARLPASPSIEEFCLLYRAATLSMERQPRKISVANYCRCLRQLCALAGVRQIRELTRTAIEKARDVYRAEARAEGRADSAIQNTISKIIRNAGACFSEEARAIMHRNGFTVENPFAGIRRTQDIQPVSPLPQSVVDGIWNNASRLRDGDPEAQDTNLTAFRKRYRKDHGHKARWLPVDFRQPHPDAYVALLLALGVGLRANEIDKARWSWLRYDRDGNCFVEIHEEDDFKPKGGTLRIIKVPRDLCDAICGARRDMASPYITGGQAGSRNAESGEGYRRPETFRAVNLWLRMHGVEEGISGGHPLHRLRKQFGSALATEFGLFAAQKLLGHSSPTTTAKYYAAQTELPTLTHVRIVG